MSQPLQSKCRDVFPTQYSKVVFSQSSPSILTCGHSTQPRRTNPGLAAGAPRHPHRGSLLAPLLPLLRPRESPPPAESGVRVTHPPPAGGAPRALRLLLHESGVGAAAGVQGVKLWVCVMAAVHGAVSSHAGGSNRQSCLVACLVALRKEKKSVS